MPATSNIIEQNCHVNGHLSKLMLMILCKSCDDSMQELQHVSTRSELPAQWHVQQQPTELKVHLAEN